MPQDCSTSALRLALGNADESLLKETEALIERATPLLSYTTATFPSGTSHTSRHTSTVEIIASRLVTPGTLSQLGADEIQLLILACHFHDLGMSATEAENRNEASRDHARRDHAVRIGERIAAEWRSLGFRDHTLADALAEVCRGHRPKITDGRAGWSEISAIRIVGRDRTVRLRSMSAIVYAADELHIGADRAPRREQEWLQILNEESRRHWTRHQCIDGPAFSHDAVRFDVTVSTPVLEGDIRRHVLRKACAAIRDANVQLTTDGFVGSLPSVSATWRREEMWKLLILESQADHIARPRTEIIDAIGAAFLARSAEFDELDGLCIDATRGGTEIHDGISRAVADFDSRGYLVAEERTNLLRLDTGRTSAIHFFEILRRADNTDVLFDGRYAARHEFDFLRSPYGKSLARDFLTPLVNNDFGVNLAAEPDEAPVVTTIGSSPTTVRLLTQFSPAPSVLVKRHLLRLMALAGASLDLLRCPELMLDTPFRHAIHRLTREVAQGQTDFIRFIEELALVGGYTYEQVGEAVLPSESLKRELHRAATGDRGDRDGSTTSMHFSQSIPVSISPTNVSFPYLLLAGIRSGVTVELLNTKEAPFEVTIEAPPGVSLPDARPLKIAVARGKAPNASRLDLRVSISLNPGSDEVECRARMISDSRDRKDSLIIGLPFPGNTPDRSVNGALSLDWPAVTAQQLRDLLSACHASQNGGRAWNVIWAKDGKPLAKISNAAFTIGDAFAQPVLGPGMIDFLCSFGSETPLPICMSDDETERLANANGEERIRIHDEYRARSTGEKTEATAMRLVCSNGNGQDIREWFLGIFSAGFFGPPALNDVSEEMQADFVRQWNDPAHDITVSAFFEKDFFHLADEVRGWAEDPSKPFPLDIRPGAPPSPVSKTRLELILSPRIDRLWYVERPILFRVSPINDSERWVIEALYWEAKGDTARAGLLRERVSVDAIEAKPPTDSTGPATT